METEQQVKKFAANFNKEMVNFAQKLIRCPSLSGEEEAVSEIILTELKKVGYDEFFRDEWGNIVGIVRGTEKGPTIMYNGHMDHVDIGDISEWGGYDPYGGVIDIAEIQNETGDTLEKTEVIHGRAAADTKCGIACQVYSGAVLIALKKAGYGFKGNYMVSMVVLEEPAEQIGMIGLYDHTLPERGIHVDGVVSCEATGLKLYLGHRGRVEIKVEITGVHSHASAPWLGINAVNKATKFIDRVDEKYKKDYKQDVKLGRASIALTNITCKPGSMSVVPDHCSINFDRRIVPQETPDDAVQEIIDELAAEDKDFHATVKIDAVPRSTYTGKTVTIPNIKEGWKIDEKHPFVQAATRGLRNIGEPVSYSYWDFGTDLAMICGRHHVAAIGYSPMQEYYCHRSVDMCRIDFMERALIGNIAIFNELAELKEDEFRLPE